MYRFSIIIPTLNEEGYLPGLLRDLAHQTLKNFEIVVVDGKSKDHTVSRAESFTDKFPIKIKTVAKANVGRQRNLGAREAGGEWLIFMDADNRINRNFLKKVGAEIKKTKPDIFTCWHKPDSKELSDETIALLWNVSLELLNSLKYPSAPGAMIGVKKEVFEKTKGFNNRPVYAEDGEFVRNVIRKGYRFEIFRDIRFTVSYRRFRKEGTLKVIRRHAVFHFKKIARLDLNLKKEYPAGGLLYKETQSFERYGLHGPKKKDLSKEIEMFLGKFRTYLKIKS